MFDFYQRYLEYRHVGFNRLDALRFSWFMLTAPVPARAKPRPSHIRLTGR